MSIEQYELMQRIARARESLANAARPRAAESAPADVGVSMALPPKRGVYATLSGIPVLGYAVRIAGAVFNMPHIVANLQVHYTGYQAEIRRLNLQVVELSYKTELLQRRLDELQAQQRQDRGPR